MNKYALRQTPLTIVIGSVLASGSVAAQASTITVNDTRDETVGTLPGACTLRSAIASANAGAGLDGCDAGSAGADEIVFAPGLANSTITLSDGQMEITGALTITGPVPGDPAGMTIDGDGQSRIFWINGAASDPFDVHLDSVILTGGYTSVGGGLRADNGNVTLTSSMVSGNTARNWAGGLIIDGGDATLINSTVSGNTAVVLTGGLGVYRGDATLINSTVSGNTGGGLRFSEGNVTLTHSTVAYNTAGDNTSTEEGIDLSNPSSFTLYNSLVVQAGASETACSEAADEHRNTLVTDTSCTGIAALPALINLGLLADNGGPTQTHALNVGSIAIDAAGDCATDFNITEDQRGAGRPIDGDTDGTAECDIGAYEFQDMLFRDRFEQL